MHRPGAVRAPRPYFRGRARYHERWKAAEDLLCPVRTPRRVSQDNGGCGVHRELGLVRQCLHGEVERVVSRCRAGSARRTTENPGTRTGLKVGDRVLLHSEMTGRFATWNDVTGVPTAA